jgi:glycine betaine/choline ABC-type transport system substrate-binding protein
MKKYTLSLLIAMIWITLANATDSTYVVAMKKQIISKNSIASVEDVQNVKNGFL